MAKETEKAVRAPMLEYADNINSSINTSALDAILNTSPEIPEPIEPAGNNPKQNGPEANRPVVTNNDELYSYLDTYIKEHQPESKETRQRRERKEKIEGIISASSDAARAISNMISVHNYAPNMYDGDRNMTTKMRERFEKEKAERKAEDDKWFQYVMMRRKLGNEDAAIEYQRGRDELQDKIRMSAEARAQAKADRDAKMADLKMQLLAGKIDEQEYQTQVAEAEAEYAGLYYKNRAIRVGQKASGGGSKGGSTGQFTVKRRNDKGEWEYKTGFKTEAAARNFATTYASDGWFYETTPVTSTSTSTKKDMWGRDQTSTSTSTRDVSTQKGTIGW